MKLLQLLSNVQVTRQDTGIPHVDLNNATIGNIMQVVFGIAGSIAFLIIVIAGLQYVISQGNPQATNKAKDTILYALIGLVICISAFGIIEFVMGAV